MSRRSGTRGEGGGEADKAPTAAADGASAKRREFEDEALVHLEALYGQGLRLTGGDEARSEDLVQETILKAWRAWDSYETGTNCKAWLMTILRNTFINEFRRKQNRPTPVDYDDVEERPAWTELRHEDPAGDFFDRIIDDEIVQAVEDLPEPFRVTLVLADLHGLSYEEIARELEVAVGTVKSRLHRARRRLQRELHDYARSRGYVRGGDADG